jgi:hypothetical protein
MNAVSQEWYQEKRRQVEAYFVEEHRLPDPPPIALSPSSRYRLEVSYYSTGPGTWNYSRGIVTRIEDGSILADVKRNYSAFPYTWIDHPSGNEYLLCGEDYQGYTVVDLTHGTTSTYVPPEAQQGVGFCWAVVYPSPDGRTLAVDGCYWAAPYELKFYDFAHPSVLPLPELGGSGTSDYDAVAVGWEDSETFVMKCTYVTRKSDGARYDQLPAEEQNILDHDLTLTEALTETVRWQRPPIPTC